MAVARQEGATLLSIGIVSTHLHVLLEVSPTTNLPRLLQRMKGGSSVIAQREAVVAPGALKWAKG
jgi:REP element-mobilizing transposase RayT